MSDVAGIEAWKPKFEEWVGRAVPLLREGKAQEAFGSYPWFTTEGEPFARLARPAREARFALIATGGYSIEGEQEPYPAVPGFGDDAPRLHPIPLDVDREKLRIDHPGYDHRFAEEDPNVNLPLDRLNELVAAGEIGSVANEIQVLMGLQPNVAPLLRETIPELAARFEADEIEAALLVPS